MSSEANKKQKTEQDQVDKVLAEIVNEGFFQLRFHDNASGWDQFHQKFFADEEGRNLYLQIENQVVLKSMLSRQMRSIIERDDAIVQRDEVIVHKDKVIVQRDEAIVQRDEVIVHKDEVLLTMTIAGLLQMKDSTQLKPLARGTASSHVTTSRVPAKVEKKDFSLCVVPSGEFDPWKGLANLWGETSSSLLSFQKDKKDPLGYFHEADIQGYVFAAATDAVYICNQLLSQVGRTKYHLSHRREASLLSANKPDHTVIFDSVSGNSILTIEDKKPCPNVEQKEQVLGQVYDCLLAMATLGHPNPFGVLTTFSSTWVCWLHPGDVEIAQSTNRFDHASLSKIVQYLPATNTNSPQMGTPPGTPPLATPSTPPLKTEPNEKLKPMDRKFYVSEKAFEPHELVPVLCNAIICAIQNFNWNPRTINLYPGCGYKGHFLGFTTDNYQWVTGHLPFSGNPAKQDSTQGNKFYVVEQLGGGETSRALRAVTEEGDECVIKMYVRMFEDNVLLDTKDFKQKAEESVKRELDHYHTIYGDDLEDNVWTTMLMGFHCIILPYFTPVENRHESLPSIKEVLSRFKHHNLGFADSDMLWRHVGVFGGKVYLFDLADLKTLNENERETYVGKHIEVLEEKLSHGLARI